MEFFDELTSKLAGAGQEAAKKAKELVDLGKINLKINSDEKKLTGMYEYLGASFYLSQKDGVGSDFSETFQEIDEQQQKLTELRQERSKIRNVKTCPKCEGDSEFDANYCSKCGLKFTSEKAASGEQEEEYLPEFCPGCGAKLVVGTKSCPNCFKKF